MKQRGAKVASVVQGNKKLDVYKQNSLKHRVEYLEQRLKELNLEVQNVKEQIQEKEDDASD